ncbi:MAG TPA: hypothetical protein VJ917_01970 [Saprospiraceae bacterium]|nr:hypothetical protein [Saprospiraceae bacterium]
MKQNNDRRIKRAFENRRVDIDKKGLWERVEAELPEEEGRRPLLLWWFMAACGFALLAAAYMGLPESQDQMASNPMEISLGKSDPVNEKETEESAESSPSLKKLNQAEKKNHFLINDDEISSEQSTNLSIRHVEYDQKIIAKIPVITASIVSSGKSETLTDRPLRIPLRYAATHEIESRQLYLPENQAVIDLLSVFEHDNHKNWSMYWGVFAGRGHSEWMSAKTPTIENYADDWAENQNPLFVGGSEAFLKYNWPSGIMTGFGLAYLDQTHRLDLNKTSISGSGQGGVPRETYIRSIGDTLFSGSTSSYEVRTFTGRYHQRTQDIQLSAHLGYTFSYNRWRCNPRFSAYRGIWRSSDWVVPNREMAGWQANDPELDLLMRERAGWQGQVSVSVAYQITKSLSIEMAPIYRRDLQGLFKEESDIQIKNHFFGISLGTNYQW